MLLPLMQHVTSAPTGRPLSVSSRGSWQYFPQQESTVLALLDNLYHVTPDTETETVTDHE